MTGALTEALCSSRRFQPVFAAGTNCLIHIAFTTEPTTFFCSFARHSHYTANLRSCVTAVRVSHLLSISTFSRGIPHYRILKAPYSALPRLLTRTNIQRYPLTLITFLWLKFHTFESIRSRCIYVYIVLIV